MCSYDFPQKAWVHIHPLHRLYRHLYNYLSVFFLQWCWFLPIINSTTWRTLLDRLVGSLPSGTQVWKDDERMHGIPPMSTFYNDLAGALRPTLHKWFFFFLQENHGVINVSRLLCGLPFWKIASKECEIFQNWQKFQQTSNINL